VQAASVSKGRAFAISWLASIRLWPRHWSGRWRQASPHRRRCRLRSGGDGIGLDDYLVRMKSPAAHRVDAQFQKAIDAVQAINAPLEEAIGARERVVKQAHDECRALEILLKVEAASTLGVTLTFKSTDGD
jgi:hypothetical protein